MNIDVNSYIGIPYSDCNCWELICKVYRESFSMDLPDLFGMDYNGDTTAASFLRRVWDSNGPFIENTEVKEPRTGDIVLLRVRGAVMHVGIFIGPNLLLHSLEKTGVVVEPMYKVKVNYKVVGYYRVHQS